MKKGSYNPLQTWGWTTQVAYLKEEEDKHVKKGEYNEDDKVLSLDMTGTNKNVDIDMRPLIEEIETKIIEEKPKWEDF